MRVVHREQTEIRLDYVNQPDASSRSSTDKKTEAHPGLKLIRVVAFGFGLLCFLQVALNVSLRLALASSTPATMTTSLTQSPPTTRAEFSKQGWVYFQSSFYYISSTKKSWQESREDCQRRGADLVIIDNKEEQEFMRLFHKLTWIGLQEVKRRWTWVDGTPLTKSYWGSGEPNNYQGIIEDCVEIRFYDTENSWNDNSCKEKNFWICEKNVAL